MTCSAPSSEVITFSPALTSTPEETTISVTSEYGPCASLSQLATLLERRTRWPVRRR